MKLTRTFALLSAIVFTMTLTACEDDEPVPMPPSAPTGGSAPHRPARGGSSPS